MNNRGAEPLQTHRTVVAESDDRLRGPEKILTLVEEKGAEMPRGVRVEEIEEDSCFARGGVRAGDRLLSINGREVEDHLDVRFHSALGDLDLEIDRGGERVRLHLPESPFPMAGVTFEQFRTKVCECKCIFCFIDQLPAGVRPSLRVKDEDFRLSFLHGNYTTLSTLRDREIDRIVEQTLSPLYVSTHAVDEDVRNRMIGRKPKRPFLPTMERLLDAGIELWGQVVLCPGVNDGAVLDETISVLSGYHPGLRGVAVVPLGLSAHRAPHPLLRPVTGAIAREVIGRIESHQTTLLPRIGTRFVQAGDEFYLKGGLPIPPAGHYEDFGMLEDGIGMVRNFREIFDDEFSLSREGAPRIRELTLLSGALFGPVLEPMLSRMEETFPLRLRTLIVKNGYLGETITVAGLLGGADIGVAIREAGVTGAAAIPAEMVSRANGLLIDDYTPERIRRECGLDALHVLSGADDLFRLLWTGTSEGTGVGTYPAT